MKVERRGIRWYWRFYHSGYGFADGHAWTRRGAERKLRLAAAWFFLEEWNA